MTNKSFDYSFKPARLYYLIIKWTCSQIQHLRRIFLIPHECLYSLGKPNIHPLLALKLRNTFWCSTDCSWPGLSLVSCLILDQELHQLSNISQHNITLFISLMKGNGPVLGLFSCIQSQSVDVNAWHLNEQLNIFHDTVFALYQSVRWDWLQTNSYVIDVFSKAEHKSWKQLP